MTLRPITDIKRLRKKYDISQKQLAKDSGVSQSMIAKIESGKVEPTYSKVEMLFETLDTYQEKKELKAKDIMFKKVISVKINDKLEMVREIITKKGISQLPVLCKGVICGLITETDLLKGFSGESTYVGDVMGDAPPVVSINTKLPTLHLILQDSPVIVITDKGEIKGIITKVDLLKNI